MISTIFISKVLAGVYEVQIEHCGNLIGEIQSFDCIHTAISEVARNIPPDFGTFLNFSYGGMCTGTILAKDAPVKAAVLADRLVELNAELHLITETVQ